MSDDGTVIICPNCEGDMTEAPDEPGLWICHNDVCGYTEDRG